MHCLSLQGDQHQYIGCLVLKYKVLGKHHTSYCRMSRCSKRGKSRYSNRLEAQLNNQLALSMGVIQMNYNPVWSVVHSAQTLPHHEHATSHMDPA